MSKRMHRLIVSSTLFLLIILGAATAQDLLIRDAQVVDPVTRTVRRGSVVIRDGRILEIVRRAPATFRGDVIDAGGRWLIPGLNDLHVHAFGNAGAAGALDIMGPERVARVMLYCGVTGFLDLFSVEEQILGARDRQRTVGLDGADIYAAGPILTSTGGHGTEYGVPTRIIDSPADARREVDALAKKRPDVVKIVYDHAGRMPTIDRATLREAIAAAKEHNLATVVHIGTWQDALEAVEDGASAITHMHGPDEIPDALVTLMRKRRTYLIPTLAVHRELINIVANPLLLDEPLLAAVASPAIVSSYRDTAAFEPRLRSFMGWLRRLAPGIDRSIARAHRAGIPILAGTDVGNPGTFHGYSLHRELELLVAAGLSEWDALASATTLAGRFLGVPYGVRPGDIANLVILEASPIERIANTRRISAVIHHGRIIDRAALLSPPSKPWTGTLIDDFSSESLISSAGPEWSVDTDASFGGGSTAHLEHGDGVLRVTGKLLPKSGTPGLAGISLRLDPKSPVDLSSFTGIRIRVAARVASLQLKVITAGVTNYDYHAAVIGASDELRTVEVPFSSLRQFWSAPMPWKGTDVLGVALWVGNFGMPQEFEFAVDSIELY